MKIVSAKSIMMAMATGAMAFSACSHDTDLYEGPKDPQIAGTEANFREMVGDIDQNHTWETVKNVDVSSTMHFSTPIINVQIFADGKLVGTTKSTDGSFGKITVSVPSYTTDVAAKFITADGFASSKTTPIKDGSAAFGNTGAQKMAATRAGSNRTCIPFENVTKYTYRPEWGTQNSWVEYPSAWNDTYYYVAENAFGDKVSVSNELLERINNIVPENDKSDYYDMIIQDVELTTEVAGPVTLTCLSATTSNQAAIGYYFYDSKEVDNTDYTEAVSFDSNGNVKSIQYQETKEPKKLANKYIIIPNVKDNNLFQTEQKWEWNDETFTSYPVNHSTATEVKLLYVDEQTGEVSETFPAGIKIGFFIVPNAYCYNQSSIDVKRTVFSLGAMNVNNHTSGIDDGPYHVYNDYYTGFDTDEKKAMSHAATFMVDDKVIIGFEDAAQYNGTDFDYNDCIFMLDGTFKPNIPDPEKPVVQKYTYCYEDMDYNGGDYDFNDCVLKVSAPVNGEIEVTLAAAGATYQLKAGLDDKYLFDGRELHEVFGVSSNTMVNTGNDSAEPVTVKLNVGENWNIADNGNFWIEVINNSTKVLIPAFTPGFAPGNVPYAIRIADDFDYPSEKQRVSDKYPAFTNWANDATQAIDWYKK